jgi:hypothetical protein
VNIERLRIILIDKTLLSIGGTIGGLFLPVKGYFAGIFCIEKQGLTNRLGTNSGTIEKSAHCLVESHVKKAFMSTI